MVEEIYHMVTKDRRIEVRKISEAVSISTERMHNILYEKSEVKNVCEGDTSKQHEGKEHQKK